MKDGEELKQRVAPMTKLEALQLARDMLRNAHSPMEFVPKCPECDRIRELDALIMDEKARPEERTTRDKVLEEIEQVIGAAEGRHFRAIGTAETEEDKRRHGTKAAFAMELRASIRALRSSEPQPVRLDTEITDADFQPTEDK